MGGLEEGVVIGQFIHLPRGHSTHFGAAIANVDAPKTCHGIQNFMPVAVGQIDALGPCDDARALLGNLVSGREGMHVMRGVQRLQFGGGQVVCDGGHGQSSPTTRVGGQNMIKL